MLRLFSGGTLQMGGWPVCWDPELGHVGDVSSPPAGKGGRVREGSSTQRLSHAADGKMDTADLWGEGQGHAADPRAPPSPAAEAATPAADARA